MITQDQLAEQLNRIGFLSLQIRNEIKTTKDVLMRVDFETALESDLNLEDISSDLEDALLYLREVNDGFIKTIITAAVDDEEEDEENPTVH